MFCQQQAPADNETDWSDQTVSREHVEGPFGGDGRTGREYAFVNLKAIKWGTPQDASGGMIRTVGVIQQGIEQDVAKRISKDIKAEKFKVKVQIESDKLRVSGPKRDDLQEVISFLREQDYGIPLQFANYR